MAAAYGNLVKSVFLGTEGAVSPWEFKKMIAKKAPVFSGYSQQDSMELLSYLLDGLHEDLNQIKNKPILPSIDLESEENPEENANRFWNSHLQRNKSRIVDLVYGQYKSKITCSKCDRISVTYDPFSIVTLPVGASQENDKYFQEKFFVYFVSRNPEKKPEKVYFQGIMPKNTVKEMTMALALAKRIKPENIALYMLVSFEIKEVVKGDSNESVKTIADHSGIPFYYDQGPPDEYNEDDEEADEEEEKEEKGEPEKKEGSDSKDFVKMVVTVQDSKGKIFSFPKIRLCKKTESQSNLFVSIYKILRPFIFDLVKPSLKKCQNILEEVEALFPKDSKKIPYKVYIVKNSGKPKEKEASETQIGLLNKQEKLTDWISESEDLGEHIQVKLVVLLDDVRLNKCEEKTVSFKKTSSESTKGTSLLTCLELFSEAEVLSGDNQWYCSRCKKHVNAKKEMNIWKASKYLILQLNRFKVNRMPSSYYGRFITGGSTSKNSDYVSIPTDDVDLSQYILENGSGKSKIYDLIAVSNHYGGYGGGHYTATVRHYKGNWIYCNDSSVSSGGRDIGSEAYLLVYRRKD